jgi:hypothetical protein
VIHAAALACRLATSQSAGGDALLQWDTTDVHGGLIAGYQMEKFGIHEVVGQVVLSRAACGLQAQVNQAVVAGMMTLAVGLGGWPGCPTVQTVEENKQNLP